MKIVLSVAASIMVLAAFYLLLWPVPVNPVAWDAPLDRGLVDPYEANDLLTVAQAINLGEHSGPEDVTVGLDGHLYTGIYGGSVLRIDLRGTVEVFAETGGRPLGIETDADGSLLLANAYLGLQRIGIDGSVKTLLSEVNGKPLVYVNDLAVSRDGTIYFSEASSKFGAKAFGGTYAASLLDILEHGAHGQIIEYRPTSGAARVIIEDLNFANGVALSDDENYLLIAETGAYRILKYWLRGPSAGDTEILIDNLPGFPDNINSGINGRFWIGLVAPRSPQLDELSAKPFVRKIVQRLPAEFRPKAESSSHVIAINGDGEVLMNMQDPDATFPALTGVLETNYGLILTSLFGNQLAWIDKRDL